MPYAHLTNLADYDEVLGEIRDFLNATGDWTIHQDLVAPDEGVASGGRQFVASNGDVLVGLRSTDAGVGANRLYLFDGVPPYASGPTTLDSLNNNSGIRYSDGVINSASQPSVRHLQQFAGPFPNVHLFSDDPSTYLHAAIEVAVGIWKHLTFGHLLKFGTWTGGGYYAATFWATDSLNIDSPGSASHHVPFDNSGSSALSWTLHYEDGGQRWIAPGLSADTALNGVTRQPARATFRGGTAKLFKNYPESSFSGRIPMGPVLIQRLRVEDTPDTIRWVGQVPDLRTVNVTNIAPADSLFIGADEYLCFPLVAKNGATDQYNSGVAGIAYLKRS